MKILVVDDSIFSQKTTIKFLKSAYPEAEYMTANDGEEGLVQYESILPDLVMMDLLMPKMSGQESLVKIREKYPNAKVVILSADVQSTVREEVIQLGALGFINKPLNADKLKELQSLLEE